MSMLGDAIRDNADLHRAIYRIVGDLAASRRPGIGLAGHNITGPHLDSLCELAAVILPHLPPPAHNTLYEQNECFGRIAKS
jgi:hypothetical protein